jgi:hypothetical protein
MGRKTSFYDREFGTATHDDDGEFEPDLVFVIMPFREEFHEEYQAIQRACRDLGLRPRRADEGSGSGFVIRDITRLIENAEFIVCDLTLERPNVYYELGYAHGVGNESHDILLVSREGTSLHFDIGPLRVRYYSSPEHLYDIAKVGLREMIAKTRR